ncbi:MAG: HEAT repeat domain-containing protein, partial [Planctomycetia bacterium]|nr:HEAT repeat domain-containing protein [Planctomycetia bacterium]
LQTSSRPETREDAAHDLREVDWRCHPEVLGALAYSLLHDGDEEVREEAAESLTKMRACVPVVHAALSQAATLDPDGPTRREARRGLRNFVRHCDGACKLCGTTVTATRVVVPGPSVPRPLDDLPASPPLPPPPPLDSSVTPPPPTELTPLPPGEPKPDADGLRPLGDAENELPRPASRTVPGRPKVAITLPGVLRVRPAR